MFMLLLKKKKLFMENNRCFIILNGYKTSIPKECSYCFWYSSKSRIPRCCQTRKNVRYDDTCEKFYNVYMVQSKPTQLCLEF